MRIVHLTACWKPVVNGVTHVIDLYRRYQRAAGHEVQIVTYGPAQAGEERELVLRNPGISLGKTGYYYGRRLTADSIEALQQADIIHCHHLFLCMERAAPHTDAPIVYTNHTRYDLYTAVYLPIWPKWMAKRVANRLMRRLWPERTKLCRSVIAPSGQIKEIMQTFGVKTPIHVIPNGVETKRFHASASLEEASPFDPGCKTGIYVGRLSPEKGLERLIEAMHVASQQVAQLRLLVVGGGPGLSALSKAIKKAGLEGQVKLCGWIPYEQLPAYYQMADFFVTPSTSEVHPLTVLEAMAAGLPILGYQVPSLEEIVDEHIGFLCEPERIDSLANGLVKMIDFCNNVGVRERIRERGLAYDVKQMIEKSEALYQSLTI